MKQTKEQLKKEAKDKEFIEMIDNMLNRDLSYEGKGYVQALEELKQKLEEKNEMS